LVGRRESKEQSGAKTGHAPTDEEPKNIKGSHSYGEEIDGQFAYNWVASLGERRNVKGKGSSTKHRLGITVQRPSSHKSGHWERGLRFTPRQTRPISMNFQRVEEGKLCLAPSTSRGEGRELIGWEGKREGRVLYRRNPHSKDSPASYRWIQALGKKHRQSPLGLLFPPTNARSLTGKRKRGFEW